MQAAKDLVVGALSGHEVVCMPAAPVPVRIDSATAAVVNKLFAELQAIYPAWKQAWPTDKAVDAAKRSWAKAFVAAGLNTLEQLRFGLQQCRADGSDFVPSAGKFIKWCQPAPEALGLPAVGAAFLEACRLAHPAADRTQANVAVYHAAVECGLNELLRLPADKARRLFERCYAITVRLLLAGEPLRAIPKFKALPARVSTPEVGRSALADLRKAVGRG